GTHANFRQRHNPKHSGFPSARAPYCLTVIALRLDTILPGQGTQQRISMKELSVTEHSVTVLAGGLSHERDVSLRSGRRLSVALREEGLTVDEWDTDANLLQRL